MSDDYLNKNLYSCEANKENYFSLLRNFNRDSAVAFMGAGLPANLRGVSTWEELPILLAGKLKLRSHQKKQLSKIIMPEKENVLPRAFSYLHKHCSDKNIFFREIFSLIKPNTCTLGIYTHLHNAFQCFVSINFYDPIQQAFELNGWKLNYYYFCIPSDPSEQLNSITFLHGHENIGFGIARQEDYEYFYPTLFGKKKSFSAIENTLEYLFYEKTIVFFGCGLESTLRNYFTYLLASSGKKKDGIKHYWVIPHSILGRVDPNKPDEKKEIEKTFFSKYWNIRIKPILYSDGHGFQEHLARSLSQINKTDHEQQPEPSKLELHT